MVQVVVIVICLLLVSEFGSVCALHPLDRSALERSQSAENLYSFPKSGVFKFIAHVSSKAGICTGSVINKEWVLTAAHCFYFRGKQIGNKDARIMAGIVNYEYPNAETKQETMSTKIAVHPSFWENKPSKFDVALVRLRDPLEFGDYVDKIEVAGEGWPQTENETENCMSLGFGGYYSTAPATADLKVWNVTAQHSQQACPCAHRFQWKRLVCVRENADTRLCQADDGGPLVCGDVVVALAHMVWNRVTCDDISYPKRKCVGGPSKALTLYMFLCPLADWMHSVVSDIPVKPPSCGSSRPFRSLTLFIVIVPLWISFT